MEKPTTPQHKLKRALQIGPAVRLVWRAAPGWTAANLVLQAVQGCLPLVQLYLMKLLVDAVTAGASAHNKSPVLAHVAFLLVLSASAAILDAFCRSIAGVVSEYQSQTVTDYVQGIIYAKSIEMDLAYYENPEFFDTLHQAQQESAYRPNSIVQGLSQLVQSTISLIAVLALLIHLNWIIAIVLFVSVLPEVFVKLKYSQTLFRWVKKRTEMQRWAWYWGWLLTGDQAAKEVRLLNLGRTLLDRWVDIRTTLRHERLKIVRNRSFSEVLTRSCATAAVFGSCAYLAYRVVREQSSVGDLVMYFGVFQRGLSSLQQTMGTIAQLYEDNLFLSYLQEFLNQKPSIFAPQRPSRIQRPMANGIVFDNVCFKYPTSEGLVLDHVSLRIEPGQTVALVGENGSGKTTLIKLLARLYDPVSGCISADGTDLREYDPVELRREFAVVLQDYMHYDTTALENIWLGDIERPPELERIRNAARHAGIDDVLSGFERGYDTVLGRMFDDAQQLSIGQWQKLALARAFVRNAQVIVLDEPTSAMDARAEYEFFARFRELARGRTTVLISHRFSTVRMADYIYVLEDGRIGESGSHDELMQIGGKYARLFEMQSSMYK